MLAFVGIFMLAFANIKQGFNSKEKGF